MSTGHKVDKSLEWLSIASSGFYISAEAIRQCDTGLTEADISERIRSHITFI